MNVVITRKERVDVSVLDMLSSIEDALFGTTDYILDKDGYVRVYTRTGWSEYSYNVVRKATEEDLEKFAAIETLKKYLKE